MSPRQSKPLPPPPDRPESQDREEPWVAIDREMREQWPVVWAWMHGRTYKGHELVAELQCALAFYGSEPTFLVGTRTYRVEVWLRSRGFRRLAATLARWDERGLRG